jgi:hypothetical protein
VDLLESNWKLVQEVLQLTRRVLMRMFVGLWPKKKEEMPVDNLKKLAEAFDTLEDPVLAMKRRSVKWGVKGAIVLAQSHGEEVDWVFQEGEGVRARHCVYYHSFGGFFDSCTQFFDASTKCCCLFFCAFYHHGACC